MLELLYITNKPEIARIAQSAGVDRIFVDMEYIGKAERQGGMDTVQNHHTLADVQGIRAVLDKSQLLVRVNPIYEHSEEEIEGVINAGADIIMLPMWKSVKEVEQFISIVNGRAKTLLLLETKEAMECMESALDVEGIDEVYIGLNDLSLSLGRKFMFELYIDGTVDKIVAVLKKHNLKFGIGGVGKVNCDNLLPAENILCEHYRLGSSMVILARAFCDYTKCSIDEFKAVLSSGIKENREYEKTLEQCENEFFDIMHKKTADIIEQIVSRK